jgi:nitroreductase
VGERRYGLSIMTEPTTADHLDALESLAARRRSNLRVDPDRAIDPALVERLVRLAATAPNHKKTYPWRFRVLAGDARAALGEALAEDLIAAGEENPAKVAKARVKYRRAPVMVVVAAAAGDHQVMTDENRDAVSAAIQTLLLGATAAGLASLWSTGAATHSHRIAELCRLDPTDTIVGLVYLGWPNSEPECPPRPEPDLAWIDVEAPGFS